MNIADNIVEIVIDAHGFKKATDLLNCEDPVIYSLNGKFSFSIPKTWGRILKLEY
ncbi:MAG: hypothetical protein PF693_19115 [Spirochaetia bacterium]|jgi:hypothetical protein|nr:hypothetical protein [Spirochaetia bacterium]